MKMRCKKKKNLRLFVDQIVGFTKLWAYVNHMYRQIHQNIELDIFT